METWLWKHSSFMKLTTATKELILDRPHVMGILNTTPDSFSDGGSYTSIDNVIARAKQMIDAGVSIIDIGGESTRPGAPDVSLEEELRRVIPAIKAIREFNQDVWISVDTSKAEVMRQSIAAGADLINDVRSLQEPGALEVAAKAQVPVCIMHMKGQPKTMQINPEYDNVLDEVESFLLEKLAACEKAGIPRENVILDPGFGFGKTLAHNYEILNKFDVFNQFKLPVLAGLSRKSMIGNLLNRDTHERLAGSLAGALIAAQNGAKIIRVHDVQETVDVLSVWQACTKGITNE